jgi:CubicO group peptidase (beta-lactamase class C family)
MIDSTGLKTLVAEIFNPYVGDPSKPQPGKCVGFLIGVTINKSRYYFVHGNITLHKGGTLPAYRDIVFFIGSNSKVFTATLLPLAASQAQIAVTPDTPVCDLLPSSVTFNQPNGQVLLWHLATHSAGFPDPVCGYRPRFGDYPFTSLNQFLNDFQPPYAPGQCWVYSNPAFALLGDVLSHAYYSNVASTSWDDTYQQWPAAVLQQVIQPLGMNNTQVDYTQVADAVAQGYNYTDHRGTPAYTPVDPPDWALNSAGLGAGALSSTLDDMLTFLEAQIEPPSSDLGDAIATTQQPWPSSNSLSMGLGWQLSNDYLDKNGGLPGYNTYMAFDPSSKVGVFVFGNTDLGSAGAAVDGGGRRLLGKIRGTIAQPSKFPTPSTAPTCPG